MKKSKIKKSITRKLSTAQYESIDVTVEIEEEVEWDTVEDRMKKTEIISKVLILDFNNTIAQALEEMNLQKKLAAITSK
jgi:hypothetical protein